MLDILTRRAHNGTALLVASHSAAVAAAADRVITLRNGAGDAHDLAPAAPARRRASARESAHRTPRADQSPSPAATASAAPTAAAIAPWSPSTTRPARSGPATASRSSGRPARANRPCCTCSPASRHRAQDTSAGRRCTATPATAPHRVGLVFQAPTLIPSMTVLENVELPMLLTDTTAERGAATAPAPRWTCWISTGCASDLPQELSGGQAQRVVIARVLAARPRLILADEPTSQLDRHTADHVADVLLQVSDEIDAALVVATHDPAIGAACTPSGRCTTGACTRRAPTTRRRAHRASRLTRRHPTRTPKVITVIRIWLPALLRRQPARLLGAALGVAIAVALLASLGSFLAHAQGQHDRPRRPFGQRRLAGPGRRRRRPGRHSRAGRRAPPASRPVRRPGSPRSPG